jgi:predicted PurR-regulated permease PerM
MYRRRFQQQTFTLTKIFISVGVLLTIFVLGIQVFLLIFAGILIALLLDALSHALSRVIHSQRKVSLLLVIVALFLMFGVSSYFFFPSLVQQISNLREVLPESVSTIRDFLNQYQWGRQILSGINVDLETFSGDVLSGISGAASATLNAFAGIFIIFFIALYLAIDPDPYVKGFIRLFPLERRKRVAEILFETGHTLKWWLLGRVLAMAAVGVLTVIGLSVLQVPMAFSLSFINALFTFIPNIGPIIAAIPAVLIGFSISPETSLYIAILYLIIQGIENYLITPIIQRKTVNLPPALALGIQVIGGVLFGFLGLALSTPLAAAALVIIDRVYIQDTLGDTGSR